MARASERDILRVGQEIFKRMKGETPSVFRKDWWSGKVMDWSMKDEAFKVEMFRFVDVFPTLKDHVQLAEHLQEYFCRPEQDFPASFQWGLAKVKPDSKIAKMASGQIEKQIVGMASRFIAGENAAEALGTLRTMWDAGYGFTLDLLGEAAVSEHESQVYFERYQEILDTLVKHTASWPANSILEQAGRYGTVPRVNVSIKVSALFSQIDPIDFQGSIDALKKRLLPLFRLAKAHGAFINLDAEQYEYKALTYELFKSILEEPELSDFPYAGIVAQAYLRDCEQDLKDLVKWAKKRKTPITVRLVKGAYWDYETIHSQQEGWPNPVFEQKWETDQSFERCTELLLENHKYIRTAIASHNVRSIAHAMVYAKALKLDPTAIEFQMLYGMAEPMKAAVTSMGYRLRDYVPIGEMIPGMAYLVRRLLENTSNESWLRLSFAEGASIERLLAAPAPPSEPVAESGLLRKTGDEEFKNEAMLDFSLANNRADMAQALARVKDQFGRRYPVVIANRPIETSRLIKSVNPAQFTEVLGEVCAADEQLAQSAIDAAVNAKKAWSTAPLEQRVELLKRAADVMRRRRLELAAWIIWEVGKGWREADADVCEAIDFCEYYAREMTRLSKPQRLGWLPGELNLMFYQPRGVAAVIAPWNFPLAILAGMTAAAVVTGNTVVMKPAEQSSIIAAKLMEVFIEAGAPLGVINLLPGYGEEVGRYLTESPEVQLIAFTGSMEVGLQIIRKAGETHAAQSDVKKVICEMGGKNAIIVDADADLDEAVLGVVHSAFGFQGQKCSACSRVIVHESCYEEFESRLVEATRSLVIGSPHDPAASVGPVIDEQAQKKIREYIRLGSEEGKVLLHQDVPSTGYYVSPTIISEISPSARLAQEEIFGPVLAVIKVSSFDEALEVANGTRFALTGGVYSRSPLNIERAREQFNVGNLYINRGITGALVYRNPFGGFKMSGVGTKAGGPNYLLQFMEPRVITENTMRRGFAPIE